MARRKQQAVIPTTSLVASAVRYPGSSARIYQNPQDWQEECYRHYYICGEARFAATFFGNAISRAVLHVGDRSTGIQQTTGPAVDQLAALFNGKDGQAQMLKAIGIHLTIAGECYLVGRAVTTDMIDAMTGDPVTEDVWEIVSVREMRVVGEKWSIRYAPNMADEVLTDDDVVIRIWNPSPIRRIEADSPFRSLLPILSEIEWLTRHVFAQTSSRLTGAGILFLPQGASFPPPPEVAGVAPEVANEASGIMLTLGDAMLTPISDPSSPAAQVPIIAMLPDGMADQVKWQTFWSELDAHALELRTEAIRRFALGMDLPPEQVLGMHPGSGGGTSSKGGVSHWGAWQIEEATIKMHIEPMLETIINALTIGYIRPETQNTNDVVMYDTATLRLRPDRSKEALELYDRGVLSMATMLRETGFNPEDDVPAEEEYKTWLLRKVASGSATPEQVGEALKQLGVDVGDGLGSTQPGNEARPNPSLEDHPTRPRTPAESNALIAADALVYRALERVGNRLRANGVKPSCPSYETHLFVNSRGREALLLDDAWTCAEQILDGVSDPEAMIPVLNSYVTSLLATQTKHTRAGLLRWLGASEQTA